MMKQNQKIEIRKEEEREKDRIAALEAIQKEKLVNEIFNFFRDLPSGKYIINVRHLGFKHPLLQIIIYRDKSVSIKFGNNMHENNEIISLASLTASWDYESIIEIWKNLGNIEEQLVETYGDR